MTEVAPLAPAGIFKAYDIRGLYGSEMDETTAHAIGRAFVRVLARLREKPAAELRVGRAACYRWRRQRAGPPVVRLPGGGGAGPAQRPDGVAAPTRRHARRTGARSKMDSYDVRFWDIKKLGNGTAARYRVRWAVDGREHCKSFKARPLTDGFLDGLKDAVRDRRPFDPRTGLPEAEVTEDEAVTWYAHARAYTEAK